MPLWVNHLWDNHQGNIVCGQSWRWDVAQKLAQPARNNMDKATKTGESQTTTIQKDINILVGGIPTPLKNISQLV
jgi:hypothetical protein